MGKSLALILVLVMAISSASLFMVKYVIAQSSYAPSIPQFTLQFDKHSSDRPATVVTDPYTGQQKIVDPAKHYEWETINVTIRNQPLTGQTDSNNSTLYYNVRFKGHFATNWAAFKPGDYIVQNNSGQNTVITFYVGIYGADGTNLGGAPISLNMPPDIGGQVDFQVEALWGYVHFDGTSFVPVVQNNYSFIGTESGWSSTQTITIPASSVSPNPTPSSAVPEFPALMILPMFLSILSIAVLVRLRKTWRTIQL
jgi:hypothetical protein